MGQSGPCAVPLLRGTGISLSWLCTLTDPWSYWVKMHLASASLSSWKAPKSLSILKTVLRTDKHALWLGRLPGVHWRPWSVCPRQRPLNADMMRCLMSLL